jgi:16S rRNA (cytidine1402-2'-O)-methyltransferase
MGSTGKLFLIPSPLGEDGLASIPASAVAAIHHLSIFIAEKARTARHFIKSTNPPRPIQSLTVFELEKNMSYRELAVFLQPLMEGHDVGLLSEAGCPGIADPGAAVVRLAHQQGIEVVPLAGPSSIVLALMASGMNGQSFTFHGYLSAKRPELEKDLRRLEQAALKFEQTQLFIEAPYRNAQVMETAMKVLNHAVYFGVACDLTLPTQFIRCMPVAKWRSSAMPDLQKRPTVFLLSS